MSQRLAIVHKLHSGQTLNATYYQNSAYTTDALELTRDMLNYLLLVVEQLATMSDLDPDTIQGLFNVALATYVTQQGGCVKQASLRQLSRFNGALPYKVNVEKEFLPVILTKQRPLFAPLSGPSTSLGNKTKTASTQTRPLT